MKLSDYTTESGFLPKLKCGSVEEAVAHLVAEVGTPDPQGLVRDVMHRETEGSTSVGGGLVIPHARSRHAPRLRIAVATLGEPLPVPADDGRPVDVVILLVGPLGDPRQMLRILARLARLVKQGGFVDDLRRAATAADLSRAFANAVADGA